MPEDKPYLQRVYNFMNSAYGSKGAISPNAFRSNYDAFAARLSADPKYAEKIYGALADAYGANGAIKRDAFTSTLGQFQQRVVLPKADVSDTNVGDISGKPTVASDPVAALLSSAKDIPATLYKAADGTFKEKKEPGLMADQSAFEPLIARKQEKEAQDFEKGKQLLLTPKAQLGAVDANGQPAMPTDMEATIQGSLQHLDEQDKILQQSQEKADEFYKTTGGGLYYSFIRPVYQTMLNLGKNVGAGGLRLAGDVGEGFGLDASKKILNKTADALVDHFDFNRLAREGNSSGFLNMTPTAQQGKLSTVNILPKAVEAISSMAGLMGGARVMGGSGGALFTSSFMTTYEDYRKRAKENGLSSNEADNFAITSAAVTSALEMISPNRILLGGEGMLARKTIFEAIKSGVPVKQALKQGLKSTFSEIGKENIQEFSQNVADKVIRGGTDLVTGKNRFNENGAMPSFQENLETAILTTIATGVMSGRHITHNSSPSAIERSAYTQAATNLEGFTQTVQNAVQEGKVDHHAGRKMIERVTEYKELYDALEEHGKTPDQAAKIAIEAIKSKRISERSKSLIGIKPLESVTAPIEAAQAEIATNVDNINAGVIEQGSELTSDDVKSILQETGGEAKTDQITDNDYKETGISLKELYNNNPEFKQYVDKGKLKPSGEKSGLQSPAIINSDGTIVDGMNRLAQQYVDGQENVRAIKEAPAVQEEEEIPAPEAPADIQQEGNEGVATLQVEQQADPGQQSPPVDEAKARRDKAAASLKTAYNNLGNIGIVNDPIQNQKQQAAFYKALAVYVKEELLYRVNQVKGFAGQSKSAIKRAITQSIKAEGIGVDDIAMLNDAFEQAYAEAKKIPGVLSENNDRVSYKQYIKDRILVREAGKRKGKAEGIHIVKERVTAVRKAILETLRDTGVNLSMPQKRRLLSILQNATTSRDINQTIDRATNAVTQMIWEAKNKVKIEQTKKLIKDVNKLKRSKSMILQDVEWLKQIQLPSPSKVDDLDAYNAMLKDFLNSRKGNKTMANFTKEQISELVDQENARIYQEKMQSMQEDLDALKEKGAIPDDVTLDEYIALIDNKAPNKLKEGISPKAEWLKKELKGRLKVLSHTVNYFDGDEKGVIERLVKVDPEVLSMNDLIRLNNVLNNINEFGSPDGAGDIITTYEAKMAVKELILSGNKIRQLAHEGIMSKKNLSNINSALFYNDKAIAEFRAKTIGPIERALSPVHAEVQAVVKRFVALNKKHNIDAAANAKLHAYSYIAQYGGIENGEISDNLKRKVDELIDDAQYFLREGNRQSKRKGKTDTQNGIDRLNALHDLGLIDFNITETPNGKKIKREAEITINENFDSENPLKSLDDAYNTLSEGEKEVYNFALNEYDGIADKLEFVTRTFAGKEFQRERNYISQVAKKKDGSSFDETELSGDTQLTFDRRSVNSKPSGTTITRSDKKGADVYYDGDFFSNFVNRYFQSVYTAEVLPALQTVAKTVNNPDFQKYITGQLDEGFEGKGAGNYHAFKNKLIQAVNEGKYAPFFQPKSRNALDNVATNMIASGVRLALNNVWQGPKQLVPALIHNFSIANSKATAYAIGTALKSLDPTNRQYAKDRAAFLKNFTGVKRSALGSEAYDSYVDKLGNSPTWLVNTQDVLTQMRKASAFSLEKGDRAAQNTAYISGYITSLIKQGLINNPGEFDFAEHAANPNAEALAAAEQTASAINNESAREYKPDVLKDTKNAKYLWMLQGFSLNAYQNAMNKFKIIRDNRSTTAEKKEAFFHFLGYLGELSAYQLIGKSARGFQFALAGALLTTLFGIKTDESEEEKKDRGKKDNIRLGANALSDLALSSQNAVVQAAIKGLVNQGYKEWAKAEARAIREREGTFNPNGTYLSPYFVPFYGVDGAVGGAQFYSTAGARAVELISHQMHWDSAPGAEDEKSQEQKDIERLGKTIGIVSTAAAILAGSSDLMIINNKMQVRLKGAVKKIKEDE